MSIMEKEAWGVWCSKLLDPEFPAGWLHTMTDGPKPVFAPATFTSRADASLVASEEQAKVRVHGTYLYEVRPYADEPMKSSSVRTLTLSEERLARLLFETDEALRSAIGLSSERQDPHVLSESELYRRAWDRDEGGRRTWAARIAKSVFAR